MSLSQKQLLSFNQANRRFNIWVGAVRSGKTFASILKLVDLLKNGPLGDVMIIGVNRDTIQRNVLTELYKFLGWPLPSAKTTETKMYGRNIYFVGAHDESAVRRIQGSTLAVAYVDELTCIPQPFWRMLQSRLSVKGAQILCTCNPEGPSHWVKKEMIDRFNELDMIYWNFLLDDNPSLDETYKENLKKEYQGSHWYKRFILGEWSASTGMVFDGFNEDNLFSEAMAQPNYYIAAIDYGTINATCCLIAAISPTRWPQIRIEEEYYYDSQKTGRTKSDSELAEDIKRFISWRNLNAIYIDPAAASLKVELRNLDLPVLDAKNDVLPGIQVTNKFIYGKNLVIHRSCTNLIDQMQSYQWDSRSLDRGEDKPLKVNDHCFCAGTLVHTDKGEIPIESVTTQHKVITRKGPQKVLRTGSTTKITKKFTLGNKSISCTPDHKFLTLGGWISVCYLTGSDMLVIWGNSEVQKQEPGMGTNIDGIRTLQDCLKDLISLETGDISIETYGSSTLEVYPQDFIFITKTGTPLTILFPICNAYLLKNILNYTRKTEKTDLEKLPGREQNNGTNQLTGEIGIGNMLEIQDLGSCLIKNSDALNAKNSTFQNHALSNKPSFVQITVRRNGEEIAKLIMNRDLVPFVYQHSLLTNIQKQNSALFHAEPSIEKEVFNLSVENYPEFFAEGFLVHNSVDAARYLCYSAFPQGRFNAPDENLTIEQLRRKVYGNSDPLGLGEQSGYF